MTATTPQWTLAALLQDLVAEHERYADIPVQDLTLDSRKVQPGSVFVALKGSQQHGLAYADKAIEQGASAILWEEDAAYSGADFPVPAIAMPELKTQLGLLADRFFQQPSAAVTVIGVTGTDGKSSVSHFIAEALNACGKKSAVIGTLGAGVPGQLQETGLTTPDVISVHRTLADFRQQGMQYAVMEVSSHALDQQRVAGVRFAVAVLTNLGRDHLDYHKTVDAYAAAKAKLFAMPGLQAIVSNQDDDFGRQILQTAVTTAAVPRLIGYHLAAADQQSQTSEDNRVVFPSECLSAAHPQYGHSGIQVDFIYQSATEKKQAAISAAVLGAFNVYNLLAATACLLALGLDFEQASAAIQQVKPVPGRMEKVSGAGQALVVVDYAHTPDALKAALQAVRQHATHRLVCVFGCGGDRDRGKRPLMAKVAEDYADMVVLTDDNPRTEMPFQIMHDMIAGLEKPEHVAMEHNRARAIRFAINAVEPGDAVLIAGKGHETVQIVGTEKRPFDDRIEAAAALRECCV